MSPTTNTPSPAAAVVIAAADALDTRVFAPKLAAADVLAEQLGAAEWTAEGDTVFAAGTRTVVAHAANAEVAAYLTEYAPANVYRATGSKKSAVNRLRHAVAAGDTQETVAASPAFLALVAEYSGRTGSDTEAVTAAVSELAGTAAEPARGPRRVPGVESVGSAAYQGYRVAHEADDGGPYYTTEDLWDTEDHAAWDNAARWVLHHGLGGVDPEQITSALDNYAELLASLESTGALEVGLPIAGSDAESYSAGIRRLSESLKSRVG